MLPPHHAPPHASFQPWLHDGVLACGLPSGLVWSVSWLQELRLTIAGPPLRDTSMTATKKAPRTQYVSLSMDRQLV